MEDLLTEMRPRVGPEPPSVEEMESYLNALLLIEADTFSPQE
jgi:hypothetical protein